MTIGELKALLDGEGLNYFEDPRRPVVLANFGGRHGSYRVIFQLDADGRFLQFRTLAYAMCPKSHRNCGAVLQVLGHLDYEYRITKWGWDPTDGEIVAYADLWLEDTKVSAAQFRAMLSLYLPAVDMANERIAATIATGIDPASMTTI